MKIFLKNSQKTSYLENYKDFSSQIGRQNSQFLRVPWQGLYREDYFKFCEIFYT